MNFFMQVDSLSGAVLPDVSNKVREPTQSLKFQKHFKTIIYKPLADLVVKFVQSRFPINQLAQIQIFYCMVMLMYVHITLLLSPKSNK